MSPNDEPGATGFAPDEIAAIVYEARAAGKTVMAHAQATQGIKNAVVGGIHSIEHGIYLDEEVIEEMKRRGTYLVATLVAPLWVVRRAERDVPALVGRVDGVEQRLERRCRKPFDPTARPARFEVVDRSAGGEQRGGQTRRHDRPWNEFGARQTRCTCLWMLHDVHAPAR